jgi:hypothetical protein
MLLARLLLHPKDYPNTMPLGYLHLVKSISEKAKEDELEMSGKEEGPSLLTVLSPHGLARPRGCTETT